ncbi:hypothetical protein ABFY54_06995 [Priestia megaterium]|uniref:hypothetical protein n=1 Tax=Priestia megaterium TaxID=1404 RepID=UPI003D2B1177
MNTSKVLYTLRGTNCLMLSQFSRESDDEPLLLEEEKGLFVEQIHELDDVALQNGAASPGVGTPFVPVDGKNTLSFEITGTSTSRTIVFEIAGPRDKYIPITAYSVNNPFIWAQQTKDRSNGLPESWIVQIPDSWSFRTRITSVTDGNIKASGKAVA